MLSIQTLRTPARRTWARAALLAAAACALATAASPAEAAGVLRFRGREPVDVKSHRVAARLQDGLARTTVRQTFVSPHAGALEAIYLFPVPEGATLVDVAMEVGGTRLEGLVVERQQARRVYDEIVRGARDPALVEQVGHNAFRLSVFPVLKDQETIVEITWIQHAPLVDGKLRYVYPLALAGDVTETQQDLTFVLDLRSAAPLTEVTSAVDGMDIRLKGRHEAVASFERSRARLDRDIVVEAKVEAPEASLAVRSFRGVDGATYLAAVVTPPAAAPKNVLARDITLVLDTSGSMKGQKIEQAKRAAHFLIDHARDADRVNVICFDTDVYSSAPAPVAMNEESRARLRAFVDAAEAGGSTALGDALKTALAEPVTAGRVRTVVLLTDGRPTVGITGATEIVELAKAGAGERARVFAFGVGSDLDRALLHGISAATRARAETFRPGGEIATRLSSFLTRTSTPVLADVRIDAPGAQLADVYPRPTPDVHLGEQIVLTSRVRDGMPETVRVRANVGGREIELQGDVPQRAAPGGDVSVRHLYGRQKIDFLEHALRLRLGLKDDDAYYAALDRGQYSTADEIIQDIVATSIDCGIQSAYASFLVLLPEDRARLNPRDLTALQEARKRAADARREAAGDELERPDTRTTSGPDLEEESPVEEMEKEVRDPIVKDAKVSDHNETDTDMDDTAALGDPRFNSDAPFEGPGNNGTIGIGGGAGGAFGGRRGGVRNLRAGGGGKKTQSAVDLAMEWMKNHQDPAGHWDADGFDTQCRLNRCGDAATGASDVSATALALLGFLGAGETHNSGQYKDVVKNGLRYLKQVQDAEGCFGPRTSPTFLHDHMWAALAMCEAYGLTGSRLFKDSAQRAVNFVHAAQNPYLGWGDGIRDGADNTSVTVLAVMVLKSAKMAELNVDASAFRGAVAWIDKMTEPETGVVGYERRGVADVDRPFPALTGDALTAGAVLARIFAGEDPRTSEWVQKGVAHVLKSPPRWGPGVVDVDAWYFGTLALFQVGGTHWKQWNDSMKTAIVDSQRTEQGRDERGSWDVIDPAARPGGRITTTALSYLCLEVYYRYGRVFGASNR